MTLRLAKILALTALVSWWAAAYVCAGQLLATVEPSWSPFYRAEAADDTGMLEEARKLIGRDPARVARVLSGAGQGESDFARTAKGLRADALYRLGGDNLEPAFRIYRAFLLSDPSKEERAWSLFMVGNIRKIVGLGKEARVAYVDAANSGDGPWTPALEFNLGVLALESEDPQRAATLLKEWLAAYPADPARPLVEFLLGESLWRSGDKKGAAAHFESGWRKDPKGWIVRPEAGYAYADSLMERGEIDRAVNVLTRIVDGMPTASESARARLAMGELWQIGGNIARAANAYATFLDEGGEGELAEEARLRLAVLGAHHADRVELTDPLPGYRHFYRPRPELERLSRAKDPRLAQRAVIGLGQVHANEGDVVGALEQLRMGFEDYPETTDSGRGYEKFMDLIGLYMRNKLAGASYAEIIDAYSMFRDAMKWVPSRDTGEFDVMAAEAYEGIGSTLLARAIYQEILYSGTMAIPYQEIKERILRTRVAESDPEAMALWLKKRPKDYRVALKLARLKRESKEADEARSLYLRAAGDAGDVAERVAILREADGMLDDGSEVDRLIAGATERRKLLGKAGGDPEEANLEGLVVARLNFSEGRYAVAAELWDQLDGLADEDVYLAGVANRRIGNLSRARELFSQLAERTVEQRTLLDLAKLHLAVMDLEAEGLADR